MTENREPGPAIVDPYERGEHAGGETRARGSQGIETVGDLARALRQLRRREARQRGGAELTYRELTARTGWSRGIIGQYLTGKVLPPTDRFDALVRLLGATPGEQVALATARDRVEEQRRLARAARDSKTGASAEATRAVVDGPPARGVPAHGAPAAGVQAGGARARGVHAGGIGTLGGVVAGGVADGIRHVVPRQLPVPVRHFTGRVNEMQTLTRLADRATAGGGTVVITAIDGTPGIGKTALAVCWARRVAERFPDGQLYLNLRGFDPTSAPTHPAEAMRFFLDSLQVPPHRIPAGIRAQAELYRRLLVGRRVLVVLDNARDAEQVRPLLPTSPGSLAVVTSRNRLTGLLTGEQAHPITLDLLSHAEAQSLLERQLATAQTAADRPAVDEIIDRCARLPLALSIVAARAAARPAFPVAQMAAELRETQDGLDGFDSSDPATDVRTVFSWSYRALPREPARLFRLLGLHNGPYITVLAAASLSGFALDETRRALDGLTRAHLAAEPSPGRFVVHDLLRTYAGELASVVDPEVDRRAAIHRWLDHHLHTACAAARLLSPARGPIPLPLPPPAYGTVTEQFTDQAQALRWLTDEHQVLLAALQQAVDSRFDVHTWQLAWALDPFLDRQGRWDDQAAVWDAAAGAADRLGEPSARAHALRFVASTRIRVGRNDEALAKLEQALVLYAQVGDRAGQAHTHHNLIYLRERQGEYALALEHAQQALARYQAIGDRRGQAAALIGLGRCHAQLGEHERALTNCERAMVMFQQLSDRRAEAAAWDGLGLAHRRLGNHVEAADCYWHAHAIISELGERFEEADMLRHIGDAYRDAGDAEAAGSAWGRALDILTDLAHADAEAVRTRLGSLEQRQEPAAGTSPA